MQCPKCFTLGLEKMIHPQEDLMALLANDVFAKRLRLIKAMQDRADVFDERSAHALEAQYRAAEAEYLDAKGVFARAMKADQRAA
ncbi:MAG: hypothetical protein JWQ23_26 [Herminiimonas sp.]|jgi:hypothetical protein|nr:hypothetical protein [Herminiimonas sp.]